MIKRSNQRKKTPQQHFNHLDFEIRKAAVYGDIEIVKKIINQSDNLPLRFNVCKIIAEENGHKDLAKFFSDHMNSVKKKDIDNDVL